VSCWH